jgi:predicted DNA binding CopG/RHH family protein
MRSRRRPRTFQDAEERAIVLADERGEFVPVKNQKQARAEVQAMARRTLARKAARINIRLAPADLDLLKARAKAEGLPYQTLIASLLHKYVTPPTVAVAEPPKKRRSA